jgi:hypothetical protein
VVRVRPGPPPTATCGTADDYILHIVATKEGHKAHDHDSRFKSFLEWAQKLQTKQPLVWFGDPIFER